MKRLSKMSTLEWVSYFIFQFIILFWIFDSGRAQSVSQNERQSLVKQGYENRGDIELPERPGLLDYEKALLINNPAIRTAFGQWRADVSRIAVARGLPDPKINFGYFIQNIETAVGPQEYKIGIMQMIPWLGKLKVQGDIQALKAEAAFQNLQAVIDDALLKLRMIYYDSYYLERAIDITQQNFELVNNWEKVILTKYMTDMARHSNLIKTQIEVIKLQDDLETLILKRMPLLESFRTLLNLPSLTHVMLPEKIHYHAFAYTQDEMKKIVLENNPGLRQLTAMSHATDKTVNRAKMNFLPDFSLGADFIGTGDKWNAAGQNVPESGKDPVVLMGSVNIPLWVNKQAAGVNAARHMKIGAESKVVSRRNDVVATLERFWFELDDAARKVILYRDILIPKSLESLRASEKAYIGDEADFLDLIDAQRRYLQFQLISERALVRFHKSRARIEALAGRSL